MAASPKDPAPSQPNPQNGAESDLWEHRLPLDNGLSIYLPSHTMLGATNFLVKEIFGRRRYYREGFEIHSDDTIVDVGANMGVFVLWAAPQAPRGRIVAVEPTGVIDCLELNVRLNQLENVTPIKAAVGRDGQQLEFIEYPGFNIVTHHAGVRPAAITRFLINLLYFRYKRPTVSSTAPCISLGKIMDEHGLQRVNYLKIDCEGGEYQAFRDLTPEYWRRIERVAMEFHQLQPDQKHGDLVECLKQQGFEVEVRKPFFDYYFMKFGEIWARRPNLQ